MGTPVADATSLFNDEEYVDDDTFIPMALLSVDDERSDDEDTGEDGITAIEALADPFAGVASAHREPFEAPVVDLDSMMIGEGRAAANVIDAVLAAEIERTIDGASTFTLTVADQDGEIRRSALLAGTVNCHIDGHDYRLANVAKQGTQLVLTFETLGIALLRSKKGYKRAWRRTHKGGKGLTRAEFVLSLVREIKKPKIPVTIPDLHTIRPVGKFSKSLKRQGISRQQGLSGGFKIKGQKPPAQALRMLEVALDEADHLKATKRAVLAMLCSGIGESGWTDIMQGNFVQVERYKAEGSDRHPGSNGYGGPLQGDVTHSGIGHFYNMTPDQRVRAQAKAFLKGGYGFHPDDGGAMALARHHGDWSPGQIATTVEGSGQPGSYYEGPGGQYLNEAKDIYAEWHSGERGSTVTYTRIKKYAYERQKGENSWDAIQRLAQEDSGAANVAGEALPLGFRAFFVGNRFYWISEQQLFKSRSRFTFSEDSEGVDNIDFEYDRGHPVAECTVTCRARFWTAPPGTVVTLANMGIQVDGNWLVNSISRSRGSLQTTIVLHKPQALEPEPAPATEDTSKQVPGATPSKRAAAGGIYKDANLGRIDQGIDFSGRGNVIALADGVITRAASSGTGWPGGTMIVQKLDQPVKQGQRVYRYIYYAENIAVKCKKNDRVSAGDVIGLARGSYPFTETGWAQDAMGTTYARGHEGYSEGDQTKSGKDFAEWLGFGPKKGYAYGGGPYGTGRTP